MNELLVEGQLGHLPISFSSLKLTRKNCKDSDLSTKGLFVKHSLCYHWGHESERPETGRRTIRGSSRVCPGRRFSLFCCGKSPTSGPTRICSQSNEWRCRSSRSGNTTCARKPPCKIGRASCRKARTS